MSNIKYQIKKIRIVLDFINKNDTNFVVFVFSIISVLAFFYWWDSGLALTYNDARSHLDIGRRVVEGLKPGLAQLGSVWLPLPHFLMIFTIWNDFMWHTGLSGALVSMFSYVMCAVFILRILKKFNVGLLGRILGVSIFGFNANILYLQSTAMTELLLLLTLTAAIYELICYFSDQNKYSLVKASFWVMLSTLVRYEGWFLFLVGAILISIYAMRDKGKRAAEGMFILFTTLSGFGILMWFVWNQVIFGDFLFFAFGPYSAHAQQSQLVEAGDLLTKGNLFFSGKIYYLALYWCIGVVIMVAGVLGAALFSFDNTIKFRSRIVGIVLLFSPVIFNILALFLGHSVIFIEGISGKSWFNVRYGVMFLPAAAVFGAYLADRAKHTRYLVCAVLVMATIFGLFNIKKAVTVADALYGSSGKDVSQVAGWLKENIKGPEEKVLVSAASHDAVIFSSGLPMKQIIHEGTGPFWESATKTPDKWAKYIVMRTDDVNDSTFRLVRDNKYALEKYDLAYKGNFADIYTLKGEFQPFLAKDFTLRAFGDWREKDESSRALKEEGNSFFLGKRINNDSHVLSDSSVGFSPGPIYQGLSSLFLNAMAVFVIFYLFATSKYAGKRVG